MAFLPPQWVTGADYSPQVDRQLLESLGATEKPANMATDFLTTVPTGAQPARSVNISAGRGFVKGDQAANQGVFHVVNDASENVPLTAAHATLSRVDLITVKVNDPFYFGGAGTAVYTVTAGAPSGTPAAPATPATAMPIATVLSAPAGVAAVTTSEILDVRPGGSGGAVFPLRSGPLVNQPSYTFSGLNGSDNCVYLFRYNLVVGTAGVARQLHIRPNGLTGANTTMARSQAGTSNSTDLVTITAAPYGFLVTRTVTTESISGWIELDSKIATGATIRTCQSQSAFHSPPNFYVTSTSGHWADTSTGITSLVFHGGGALLTGWITLDRVSLV